MNKKIYIIIFLIFIVAAAGIYYQVFYKKEAGTSLPEENSGIQETQESFKFGIPKKSAHYESNTPAHEQILAGVPINIVLDFNFDLADNSTISITKDSIEYGIGNTGIDSNKLSMRREMDPSAPDGRYLVNYIACWPDRSCHDGNFEFAINKALRSAFIDMRGREDIVINMENFSFGPKNIIVSPNVIITWTNKDDAIHYVNTDSHPAHTYYLPQNSKAMAKGDSFSLSFDKKGIYPYHCSAHASIMQGNILVEN